MGRQGPVSLTSPRVLTRNDRCRRPTADESDFMGSIPRDRIPSLIRSTKFLVAPRLFRQSLPLLSLFFEEHSESIPSRWCVSGDFEPGSQPGRRPLEFEDQARKPTRRRRRRRPQQRMKSADGFTQEDRSIDDAVFLGLFQEFLTKLVEDVLEGVQGLKLLLGPGL